MQTPTSEEVIQMLNDAKKLLEKKKKFSDQGQYKHLQRLVGLVAQSVEDAEGEVDTRLWSRFEEAFSALSALR